MWLRYCLFVCLFACVCDGTFYSKCVSVTALGVLLHLLFCFWVLECLFVVRAAHMHVSVTDFDRSECSLFCWCRVSCTVGGLNCRQAASSSDLSFSPTLYLSSWILIHTSKLCSSQMAALVLPSWQKETWIHFTALDTNMKNTWCTVVLCCWSVSHSIFIIFGSKTKIILLFFIVAMTGVAYSASVCFNLISNKSRYDVTLDCSLNEWLHILICSFPFNILTTYILAWTDNISSTLQCMKQVVSIEIVICSRSDKTSGQFKINLYVLGLFISCI